MDICSDLNFLKTIYLVKNLLTIVKIAVPFVLIIMITIDIYKVVIHGKDMPTKSIINRGIAAVAVFFISTAINIVLNTLGENGVSGTVCWVNANESTIALLKEQRSAESAAKEEALNAKREEQKKYKEEAAKLREERLKAAENANSSSSSNGSSSSDSEFNENGTDGMVTVEYGIFYKPATKTSGTDGTKGSGPYGYNKYFYARLEKFVAAAAAQGYTIKPSSTQYGSWRSYNLQSYYWNCYQTKSCNNGNLAAVPGSSNHGWGIASDLEFGSTSAIYWAHDNASSFGLKFNLCENIRGNCQENWHIEPTYIVARA